MVRLLDAISDSTNLWEAWIDVRRNSTDDGQLSPAVKRFQRHAEKKLSTLHHQLRKEKYKPSPLRRVLIPKGDGGVRKLAVSAVRDRIVERCIVDQCAHFIGAGADPAAHAYRPGRGVHTASEDVVAFRESGFTWCARMDIDDCFDNVPNDCALSAALPLLPDTSINSVITTLIQRPVLSPAGQPTKAYGIPQGCALSPLLLNVFLQPFDERIQEQGFGLVRYSDDIALFGRNEAHIREGMKLTRRFLKESSMKLNVEECEIMDFSKGFTFLGEEFGPVLPTNQEFERIEDSPKKALYVAKQGAHIRMHRGRIIVSDRERKELLSIPQTQVGALVCFGSVGITSGVRSFALYSDVPVSFMSRRGSYLGALAPGSATAKLGRLKKQLDVSNDTSFRLLCAREFVDSKVSHQMTVLRRLASPENPEEVRKDLAAMKKLRKKITHVSSVEQLMGIEGASARHYFHALALAVPEDLSFTGRNRRPPRDVVNAALSYAYAVLTSEATSAVIAAGLEPACGMLHAESGSHARPSLALDLMEEFRPYVVDQSVIQLAKSGRLKAEHGIPDPDRAGGVLLNKKCKKILLKTYENRMLQVRSGAIENFKGSTRRLLYRQAERLCSAIESNDPTTFTGFVWR